MRLYRPFPVEHFVRALPPTVRSIAVLDRTKEPGATGEPLLLDVIATLHDAMDSDAPPFERTPHVIGGRYGLSSKEFRPTHVKAVFDELARFDDPGARPPKRRFTVGIYDDVTGLSLDVDDGFRYPRPAGEVQAMFFGLGADGTVGANKASVKIIGEHTDLFAQGYFVYDSKKSGSVTVSHLRFGPEPIRSTYLIEDADFVACHQFGLLEKMPVLDHAKPGATFLINSPYGPAELWDRLPYEVQAQIRDKGLAVWAIDAYRVAAENELGARINTVMQPCFFALAGVIPSDEAIDHIKASVEHAYGRRGATIVERNFAAIDASLAALVRVDIPSDVTSQQSIESALPADAPDFVTRVTARMMAGEGDLLPVSALPVDGTFPTGTARYEKRAIAQEIPVWDPDICIDCGKCAIVCPHAVIRMKVFEPSALAGAPSSFKSKEFRSKDIAGFRMAIQVAPDDCTGCGVCVDVCPAKSKTEVRHKSINMEPALAHRDAERPAWDFFLSIPELDRDLLPHDSVKGSQALQPLFEFSGACAGCGETPYLKLATQLFGDRMVVANATGCSSIYGGNLPTTPWTVNAEGRGPAWSNSLFEDNAEFGLGLRLGLEAQTALATHLLEQLADAVGSDLVDRHSWRRPKLRSRDPRPARARRRAARRPRTARGRRWRLGRRRPPPADVGRRPDPQGRVDHRRRRLGLRHRFRWARPRAVVGAQRQHPRARHRGVLEHGRPGLEGDIARCRGQVRRLGQAERQEGSRGDRPGVRQRVRRRDRHRGQRRAGHQGTARGRRLARSIARDRLLDVHRPRDRHGHVDESSERRRPLRLLAVVPLPAERCRARDPVQARFQAAVDARRRVHRQRGSLRRPRPHPPGAV